VTIPTTIAGYTVTSIGEYAFTEYGDSITRVVIPNTVTRIEQGAFAGCTALTSIVIPDSVTWIGDYAFADCLSLTEVTIPDSITFIGQEAFSGCDGLSKVELPDRFLTQLSKIGLPGQLATTMLTEGMSKRLSNHEGFIAALTSKILSKGSDYGFAAKNDLKTLATKDEMAQLSVVSENKFMAKSEMINLATKSDLNGFAVKSELDRLVPKSQLTNLATKSDLTPLFVATQLPEAVKAVLSDIDTQLGPVPAITSDLKIQVFKKGALMSYRITTNVAATAFTAIGLPPGLTLNAATGIVAGKISKVGTYNTFFYAGFPDGSTACAMKVFQAIK